MEVQDKPAEASIKLNNVLTAVTIAILLWIGTSILDVKDEVASLRTDNAVSTSEMSHLREMLRNHVEDQTIHTMGHVHP